MKKNFDLWVQSHPTLKKLIMELKIAFIIILVSVSSVVALPTYSQGAKVSLDMKNTNLGEVIDKIESQSEYYFIFNQKQIDVNRVVDIQADNKLITDILPELFKGTNVNYLVFDRKILLTTEPLENNLLALASETKNQQNRITGTVTDEKGTPLPGATVLVKGTTRGVLTDTDGKYSIDAPSLNVTLVVSFVGYAPKEIEVNNQNLVNVTLRENVKGLDEVIVIGYGTQKKMNLTAAVDQVSSDALENRPIDNLTQGLQGVMPNLNIKLMDGKPIQSPSFNIRGTTSIGQGGSALVLIDGVEGDPSLLNPNDVASVSMLKDAASAAIYGARGAFGVVLITTKNPEKGKTSINYTTNYSIKKPLTVPNFVTDGYTYAKMFSEAFINGDGSFPQNINKEMKFSQAYLDAFKAKVDSGQPYSTVDIDPVTGEYVYYGSTDWYKELYKNTTSATENNLSVSGSGEKTTYLISGRLLNQKGLFRYNSDNYSMVNLRAKGTIQIFPWLRVENNADYSNMKYHNPIAVGEGTVDIWNLIGVDTHPVSPLLNPDGTLTTGAVYSVGDFWYGKNGIDIDRGVFKNTSGFTASFFKNKFRIKGDVTIRNDKNNSTTKRVPVPYSSKPGVLLYVGTATNDLQNDWQNTLYMSTNVYAEYENTFLDSHYLKIMGGYNYEQSTFNRFDATRNGLIYPDATNINLALGQAISTIGGYEKWAILGGFSRLNYSFKDRYLIEINARYDGSSKFPSNQRYAFFPSVSGGWRLSKESFWHVSPKLVSELKLRASYGSLGNGNINSYAYQEQLAIAQSTIILNGVLPQYTTNPGVLPNGLTWETSTTSNFGLDFATLSNRLIFVGDIYQRNTTNMYTIGLTLPATFGATAPKGNYANLQTKGWELSLSWRDKFIVASKPLNYDIRFTLADNRAVITKYNNPNKLLSDYYKGQVIGEIWGYTTEGFFIDDADVASHAKQSPQMRASPSGIWYPGDIKLKDLNDDGLINIGTNTVADPGDRKIIGNSSPRYLFGINLGADWNNFFFSAFFQGVGKQDWYPSTECEFFWGQYNRPYNNIPKWQIGKMWTPDNTDAYLPRTMSRAASSSTARELGVAQTKYLQNVSYIRLKSLQIGYNLPSNLVSKIGASALRIYFSGEDLWSFSSLYKIIGKGLDVENTTPRDQLLRPGTGADGFNYPMMKSYSFGLSVEF
jgi:TonB-linked SusC/RagA family outer membrane protein